MNKYWLEPDCTTSTCSNKCEFTKESFEKAKSLIEEIENNNPYKKLVEAAGKELPEEWVIVFSKNLKHKVVPRYKHRVFFDNHDILPDGQYIICDTNHKPFKVDYKQNYTYNGFGTI